MENLAINENVRILYEQSIEMLKRLQFEILLQPLDPESGNVSLRHKINFSDCIPDLDANGEGEGLLQGVNRLQDHESMIDSVYSTIDYIRENYKDQYSVTLEKVITPYRQPPDDTDSEDDDDTDDEYSESDSETESEFEDDVNSDEEISDEDSDLDYESEFDSGHEYSDDELRINDLESDYDSPWELDSGLQTDSEEELDSEEEFDE